MPGTAAPDFRDYATLPMLNVASAVALVRALLAATPKKPTPLVRRARKALEAALEALLAAWQPDGAPPEAIDRRPFDTALDRAWGALFKRLDAWMDLSAEAHPEVGRAENMLALLFADGLKFLRRPYNEQWAESDRRLASIDQHKLADELDALAGAPVFLADLRAAHTAYGEVLGITARAPQPPVAEANLIEPLHALRAAIFGYVGKLIGTLDETDADDVQVVRDALAPIDAARTATASTPKAPTAIAPVTEDIDLPDTPQADA